MFPHKEEKKLKNRINKDTSSIYELISELIFDRSDNLNQTQFEEVLTNGIDMFIDDLVDSTLEFSKFNKEEWERFLGGVAPSPLNKDSVETWVLQNLEYYKQTPQRALDKLENIRYNRIEAFTRELNSTFDTRLSVADLSDLEYIKNKIPDKNWENLRQDIQNLDKFTADDLDDLKKWFYRRNELWARNEAGNLYAMQNEELAVLTGIEKFKWITENDERVRKTHKSKNGKTFDFYGTEFLPGQEPLCRCHLEPIPNKNS